MQRVLIIGKVWPEPGSSAAGSRTMQLIHLFAQQGWKLSFASAAGESPFAEDLGAIDVDKYNVEINSSLFDELLKQLQPTIVIFDRFTTEEQFGWRVAQHCPGALRVLDTIDLHCLRQARHLALKENRPFAPEDLLVLDSAMREAAAIYRCDLSLMVSSFEMELLETLFGIKKDLLHHAPLWYPPLREQETAQWPGFAEREHFISIGNFFHEPNWDAVLYLKHEVWPLIRKKLPKTELHVYGAYATQKVQELNNAREGFLVKGRAASATEVMSKARVCLAPLRFGAGIKGKLLDSMLCGTPNVTTAIGAESMHHGSGWNGVIASGAEHLALAAAELYTNRADWEKAQKIGATLINTVFSEEEHAPLLLHKIHAILGNLEQHRLKNFTGSLLRQQNNAATRYMALWIEEKNKASKKM